MKSHSNRLAVESRIGLCRPGKILPCLVFSASLFVVASLSAQSSPPASAAGVSQSGQQPAPPPASAQPTPADQTPAPGAQPGQPSASAAPEPRKPPRAKSQDEMDAYQKFMREPNSDQQIKLIEDFLLQYPKTELKEYAYQAATQAYQAKNDYEKVLTYGELTLAENDNNLVALLILASAIPERTAKNDIDKETKLTQAEQYAKRGLDALEKMPAPPNLSEEQWKQVKKDTESTPHAALGMIALIREDFPSAEAEFNKAIDMAAHPDPITLYRLGLCYSFEKKYDPALAALGRASSSGGVKVPGPDGAARDLVAEAKDYVVKAKAASDTPVSGTAAPQANVARP